MVISVFATLAPNLAQAQNTTDFVTTWRVAAGDLSIAIPTTGTGYNYTVAWGDGGNNSTSQTGNATHTYAAAGVYQVRISGAFPRIYFNNTGDRNKIISIDQWGNQVWTSMETAFWGASNLAGQANDSPNLSSVTSLRSMFAAATAFNQNIGNWDVSSVTNMSNLFNNAFAFNQNIGNWDVSSVTDMNSVFDGATVFNQNIGNWDVSSVTSMIGTFTNTRDFNQNIGNWDVSSVTDMTVMFSGTTLSAANYTSLLIGWSALQSLQTGVTFGGGAQYCAGAGAEARAILTGAPNNWTITDGGQVPVEDCRVADTADVHRAILPQVARAMADIVGDAITGRIAEAKNNAPTAFRLGDSTTLHSALAGTQKSNGALDIKQLLNGSSFVLPLSGGSSANNTALAFWGSGSYRNLEGDGALNWDGGLASASIGLDGRPRPDVLLGVALAYSDGAFDYNNAEAEGEYDITMTSVHPYLGWSLGRLDLWATAGYGQGEIEITEAGSDASSSDADLRSVALGASGQLLSAEGWLAMPGATAVRLKSEASATRIDVNGDVATEAAALSVDATRFRLALEGTNERTLASGATVSPSLELGVRYDGGDGDSGAGLELGGGVRYTNPATGLSVEGKARVLVGRDDYDEWGVQGTVRLARGADGQGLSFSLSPGYGDSGGIQRLWRQGLPADGDDAAAADHRARLEARLGYGFAFALNGHDGMLTPYSELTLGATDRYRVGMNWKAGALFDLNLLGERREDSGGDAEHALLLQGTVRF